MMISNSIQFEKWTSHNYALIWGTCPSTRQHSLAWNKLLITDLQ